MEPGLNLDALLMAMGIHFIHIDLAWRVRFPCFVMHACLGIHLFVVIWMAQDRDGTCAGAPYYGSQANRSGRQDGCLWSVLRYSEAPLLRIFLSFDVFYLSFF